MRIPGTGIRFGLEPIIGLIPGVGDLVSGAMGFYLVLRAVQFRLPPVVIARMVANTLLDMTIGALPFLGDLFDFAYKSNSRNMALFERYASDPTGSTRGQWVFFVIVALIAVAALVGLAFVAELILQALVRDLGG
jgi:Domain of unknown function (DUF4112)